MYSTIFTLTDNYYNVWRWTVLLDGEIIAEGWADTLYAAEFAANWKVTVHQTARIAG